MRVRRVLLYTMILHTYTFTCLYYILLLLLYILYVILLYTAILLQYTVIHTITIGIVVIVTHSNIQYTTIRIMQQHVHTS